MPVVSMFYGVKITFYFDDHSPPHFHAEYSSNKALIDIQNCTVIKSSLPKAQLKLVLAWAVLHKDELMQNWELAKISAEPTQIKPLQ